MKRNWITEEFNEVNIGDKRLNSRIMHILNAISKQPSLSFNKMFHTRAEVQASYRFFSNQLVDEAKVIAPHLAKTQERINQQAIVLCLSDTTSLNFTTRKSNPDSGYISSNNAQGFFLHATIAVTPDRLHLGITGQKFWSREKEKKDFLSREKKAFVDKESYRWLEAYQESCELAKKCLNTEIIHVSDREGDIFEIFSEYDHKNKQGKTAHFLVRSNHNRNVSTKDKSSVRSMYELLENSPVLGQVNFELIRSDDSSSRRVNQTIQAQTVVTKARYGSDNPGVETSINVIYLKEVNPPENEEPICWCLVTSLPIFTEADINKIIQYYLCRWEIEVFFKTYKSGCKIEEKSLRTASRLFPMFSLFLVVAWRLNFILHMARIVPESSCAEFFERSEWKAGTIAATRVKIPPEEPPSMKAMVNYIGKLGGHLGRKNDPEPGIKALWTGLAKLHNYADAWDAFGPESHIQNEIPVKKTYA